jgi:hypothetical protein
MSITYEWDVELVDEDGEIQDHFHCGTYAEALSVHERVGGVIVLVRTDASGRQWAYVDDYGLLPEFFTDAFDIQQSAVPKRFHKEVQGG